MFIILLFLSLDRASSAVLVRTWCKEVITAPIESAVTASNHHCVSVAVAADGILADSLVILTAAKLRRFAAT